jgi:hypothetical protein
LQQQYYAYYSQCMASRSSAPPPYTAPAYPPASGYALQPGYAPPPGYSPSRY